MSTASFAFPYGQAFVKASATERHLEPHRVPRQSPPPSPDYDTTVSDPTTRMPSYIICCKTNTFSIRRVGETSTLCSARTSSPSIIINQLSMTLPPEPVIEPHDDIHHDGSDVEPVPMYEYTYGLGTQTTHRAPSLSHSCAPYHNIMSQGMCTWYVRTCAPAACVGLSPLSLYSPFF